MAAYGYIVRKFIRYGEVIPEHFNGHQAQSATAGASVALKSYDASGVVCAEISLPDGGATTSAVTFTLSLPYKIRVLPGTQIVPAGTGTTAGNVTYAVGKISAAAVATSIQTFTVATATLNTPKLVATHVHTADAIDPFATDVEALRFTVTKATGADNAATQVFLYFVRAD
jgi:hypothetical protein